MTPISRHGTPCRPAALPFSQPFSARSPAVSPSTAGDRNACKRGGGEVTLALDELEDCASQDSLEKAMDRKELAVAFNSFLESLPETERLVFLSRYWYLDPIADIAEHFGFSVSKVTSMLRRTRGRLRQALEKEELL